MNATLDRKTLSDVVRRATGSQAGIRGEPRSVALVDNPENMTTASLRRYWGALVDGTSWSVVAKTLRPASASPIWETIPQQFHAQVLEDLNWRDEPRVYESDLASDLPEGFRLPEVWRIDRAEDAITIWMEDVGDTPAWTTARYSRSAQALGRLAGRWPEARAIAELGVSRRNFHNLFFGKIMNLDLQILSDDSFWSTPPISQLEDGELRADLLGLAERMPGLLDFAEALPHGMAHGDAAPVNLHQSADGSLVAIDWSYGSSAPVGSDLGQLLAGRFESGQANPDELPVLIPSIIDSFREGVMAEGFDVSRSDVEAAFAIHMGVRTVFSLLIVQPSPGRDPEELFRLVTCRAALARAGLDLCARLSR